MTSWERFLGAMSWLQFPVESARISLQKDPRSGHDRGPIAAWSWTDRALISRRSRCRSSRKHCLTIVELIPQRTLHDRGSIAPRSRFDRTAIVEFFHETSGLSDEASKEWTVRSRSTRCSPIAGIAKNRNRLMIHIRWILDQPAMMIGRYWRRHVSPGKSSDRIHLCDFFSTCLDWWSRGLGFTRSMNPSSSRSNPTRIVAPRVLQKKNLVGT